MAHAHPQAMLQSTLQTLSQRDVAPATGADLLKDWISVLKNANAEPVSDTLTDLYDELINPTPDAERVHQLLNTAADYTQSAGRDLTGETANALNQLADSMRSFATDLDRVGNDNALADNQPDTRTNFNPNDPGDRANQLLNDTLTLLSNGADITSPEQGVLFVEDWIEVVKAEVNTQWLEAPLTQLRDALNDGNLRTTEQLMRDLAGTTQDLANNTAGEAYRTQLTNLATALISFAQPLS